jgi:hypothetical protein
MISEWVEGDADDVGCWQAEKESEKLIISNKIVFLMPGMASA